MRITEKAGELNKVFELQFSRLAPIKRLEKKAKRFLNTTCLKMEIQNLNFVKFNSWALTFD